MTNLNLHIQHCTRYWLVYFTPQSFGKTVAPFHGKTINIFLKCPERESSAVTAFSPDRKTDPSVCVCVCSMPSDVIMKRTQPFPAAPSNNLDSIGHRLCGRHAKRKDNIVPDLETITFFHKEQHSYADKGRGAKSIPSVLQRTSSYLHPAVIAIISLKNQTQIGIMIFKDLPWMLAFYKLV